MDEESAQRGHELVPAMERLFEPVPSMKTTYAVQPDTQLCIGWIAEMAGGDEAALGKFYDHFVSRVYGLALRIVRDPMIAEEVVSDTFLQVWRSSARYVPERGKPVAWLLNIARSRAIDALRRRDHAEPMEEPLEMIERGPQSSIDWRCSAGGLRPSDPFANPADRLAESTRDEALRQALATLTDGQRQVVFMAYFQGFTHEEIAQRTDMALGTVKSHIRRAQHKLKAILETTSPETGELH